MYTMEDWARDGVLSLAIGQKVSDEVVAQLRDCVPPAYMSYYLFQVGEPANHDKETGRPLYSTFAKDASGVWEYKGICLRGKQENRKGWGE